MNVFADSGSTKTHWLITDLDYNVLSEFITIGLNPYFVSEQQIYSVLIQNFPEKYNPLDVNTLNFYGSGCAIEENYTHLRQALNEFFFNAKINIFSDMLGAARAVLKNKEGIAAILGTGANSCLYNGKAIKNNAISLGYILGDEGSGANIGKIFIKLYLEKKLNPEISEKFFIETGEDKTSILNAIYKLPQANKYLANFCNFIYKNIENKQMNDIVEFAFDNFFKSYINIYPNYKNLKLGFTGSVAIYFQNILKKIAENHQTQTPNFVKDPIYGILDFHKTNDE